MESHYTLTDFAPLSKASINKLLKGHTIRVKHGSGLKMHLSKAQIKKHLSAMKKNKGYNLQFDPYQMQMHGEGFFEDLGKLIKKKVIKPLKKEGKKLASTLIHKGIPVVTSTLGGLAGEVVGDLTGNPVLGGIAGSELGNLGGNKLADYIGKKTGYGLKAKKGGKLLIDQPFTARQAVDVTGKFFKDPKKTLGFGMDGGKLLIDQPFTARQAVDVTGKFFKDPKKTLGFGMRGRPRKMVGTALLQAGYGV